LTLKLAFSGKAGRDHMTKFDGQVRPHLRDG
jgi:hypothetical protein